MKRQLRALPSGNIVGHHKLKYYHTCPITKGIDIYSGLEILPEIAHTMMTELGHDKESYLQY